MIGFTYKSMFYAGIEYLGDAVGSRVTYVKDYAEQCFSSIKSSFSKWIRGKTEEVIAPKIEEITDVIEKHSDALPNAVRRGSIVGSVAGGATTLAASALAGANVGSLGGACLGLGGAVVGGAIGGAVAASNYVKNSTLKQDLKDTEIGNLTPETRIIKQEIYRSKSLSKIASTCNKTIDSTWNSAVMGVVVGGVSVVAASVIVAAV